MSTPPDEQSLLGQLRDGTLEARRHTPVLRGLSQIEKLELLRELRYSPRNLETSALPMAIIGTLAGDDDDVVADYAAETYRDKWPGLDLPTDDDIDYLVTLDRFSGSEDGQTLALRTWARLWTGHRALVGSPLVSAVASAIFDAKWPGQQKAPELPPSMQVEQAPPIRVTWTDKGLETPEARANKRRRFSPPRPRRSKQAHYRRR